MFPMTASSCSGFQSAAVVRSSSSVRAADASTSGASRANEDGPAPFDAGSLARSNTSRSSLARDSLAAALASSSRMRSAIEICGRRKGRGGRWGSASTTFERDEIRAWRRRSSHLSRNPPARRDAVRRQPARRRRVGHPSRLTRDTRPQEGREVILAPHRPPRGARCDDDILAPRRF